MSIIESYILIPALQKNLKEKCVTNRYNKLGFGYIRIAHL